MADIKTILVTESAIADISSELEFMVTDGASQKTFQSFQANTASNSQMNFSIQIPSQEIITVRSPSIQTDLFLTLSITNTTSGALNASQLFQYGLSDSFQSFPLNSLFNVSSAQINNTSVSSNIKQIKDLLLRFYDMRKLGAYQSTTPSKIDNMYGAYADAVGANCNPLSDFSTAGLDQDFVPRGAFPLNSIYVVYVPATGSPSVLTYGSSNQSVASGEKLLVYIKTQLVEPILGLSPISSLEGFESNKAGFYGLNTLNLNFTIDTTCSRVWSSATGFIQSIQLGWVNIPSSITTITANANGFNNTQINLEFLSPTAAQVAKMSSSKNVLPYYDYSYYVSPFNGVSPVTAQGQTFTVTFPTVQLSNIPDYLVIAVRKQMSSQNWNDTASFCTINRVTINFNNASGLLSSATQTQLFELSKKNNSNQTYYEWGGKASQLYSPANGSSVTNGYTKTIPTTGSVLVVSASDLSLPMWASASSLGQFQVLITVDCTWNNAVPDGGNIPVEGILLTPSSGIFETNSGTSSAFVGVLTKEATLRAKETEHTVMGSAEFHRLVGGKGLGSMGVAHIGSHIKHELIPKVVDKIKSKLPSGLLDRPIVQRGAERLRNRLSSM
jgi:hypothetical protein